MVSVPDRVRRHAVRLLADAGSLQASARETARVLGRREAAHRNASPSFFASDRQRVAAGIRRLRLLCAANGVDAAALCAECR